MAATAKHFPGLGGAQVNTDDAPSTVTRTAAAIDAVDLRPFRAAVDAGSRSSWSATPAIPASTARASRRSRRR